MGTGRAENEGWGGALGAPVRLPNEVQCLHGVSRCSLVRNDTCLDLLSWPIPFLQWPPWASVISVAAPEKPLARVCLISEPSLTRVLFKGHALWQLISLPFLLVFMISPLINFHPHFIGTWGLEELRDKDRELKHGRREVHTWVVGFQSHVLPYARQASRSWACVFRQGSKELYTLWRPMCSVTG